MEQQPDLLESFWDLASVQAATRINAAKILLDYTKKAQDGFAKTKGEEKTKVQQGKELHPDTEYTLQRLVRGLCSGRDSARQGFSMALTEFLRQFPLIKSTTVISKLREETEIVSRMKGDEERDALLGRLFGYLALQRAGRLQPEPEAVDNKTIERQNEDSLAADVTKDLLFMGSKKSWFKEVCYEAITAVIQTVPVSSLEKNFTFLLQDIVDKPIYDLSPEELMLALVLERATQDNPGTNEQPTHLFEVISKVENIFSSDEISNLRAPLLRSTYTFPRLHCVWRKILHRFTVMKALEPSPITKSSKRSAHSGALFNLFWTKCVDEQFFLGTASHEKKATGLGLLGLVIKRAPTDSVINMLSGNLLKILCVNVPAKKNLLFQAANKSLRALIQTVNSRDDPDFNQKVLAVLRARGYHHFDQKAKTTLVSSLRKNLKEEHFGENIQQLLKDFQHPANESLETVEDKHSNEEHMDEDNESSGFGEYKRRLVIDSIAGMVKDADIQNQKSIISQALIFLTVHSFSDATLLSKGVDFKHLSSDSLIVSDSISDDTRSYIQDKLSSTLMDVTKASVSLKTNEAIEGESFDAISRNANELLNWLDVVHGVWNTLEKKNKNALQKTLTTKQKKSRDSALEAINALRRAAQVLSECSPDEKRVHSAYEKATGSSESAELPYSRSRLTGPQSVEDDEFVGSVSLTEHRRRLLGIAAVLSSIVYWQFISPDESTPLLDDFLTSMKALCTNSLLIAAHIEGGKTKKNKKSDNLGFDGLPVAKWQKEGVEGGRNMAMMVLLDGYLSMLSFGSAFLREAVKISARGVATLMTFGAVESVISVIHEKLPEENTEEAEKAKNNPESDDGESGVDEEESSDDDDSDEDEEEEQTSKHDEENEVDSSSEDDTSSEEESDSHEAGKDSKYAAEKEPEKSSEDEEMDRYEEMLTKMVKLRKAARMNKKSSEEKAKHFKFRTLDLIDTLATRLNGHPALLLFVLPLFRCFRMLSTKKKGPTHGLTQQIFAILNKICNKSKVPCVTLSDEEEFQQKVLCEPLPYMEVEGEETESSLTSMSSATAHVAIAEIMLLAGSSPNAEFLSTAGRASWLFVRSLRRTLEVHSQKTDLQASETRCILHIPFLAQVYGDALTSFITYKNSRMSPKLFAPVFQYFPALAWSLTRPIAFSIESENSSAFRRIEAFNLLSLLAKAPLSGQKNPLMNTDGHLSCYEVDINESIVSKRHDRVFETEGILAAYKGNRCRRVPIENAAIHTLEAAKYVLEEALQQIDNEQKVPKDDNSSARFLNASRQREVISFVRLMAKCVKDRHESWSSSPFDQIPKLVTVIQDLSEKTPSPPVKQISTGTIKEIENATKAVPNGATSDIVMNGSTDSPLKIQQHVNKAGKKRVMTESMNGGAGHQNGGSNIKKQKKAKKSSKRSN